MQILSVNSEIILKGLLETTGDISISELQEHCSLSRKYIAFELEKLDPYLRQHGACIRSIKGKGFEIRVLDPRKYKLFSDMFLYNNRRNQYLNFSKNLLAYQILFDIVLNDRYFSVNELIDKYHYSRGTISNSLKTVKIILFKYGCTLVSRPNYGIKVEGSEWNKRICIIYSNKIAFRMNSIIDNSDQLYHKFIDKEKYKLRDIERIIQDVLNTYHMEMPYTNVTKLKLYVILSQTRAEWYDALAFNDYQLSTIRDSRCLLAGQEISEELSKVKYQIQEKDMQAITAMLMSFCTKTGEENDISEFFQTCKEDTHDFVENINSLYYGVDKYLDDVFIDEFSCYLSGAKLRHIFQLYADEESVFQIKRDGSFMSEFCRDYAIFIYNKYKIKLAESEILSAYYIFHSSFARYTTREAQFRIILISRYGINFARDIAYRILEEYDTKITLIDVIEFSAVTITDLGQYDFLMTDIEQDRYNFIELPVITLDFFRFPIQSRSLNKYFSVLITAELQEIIQDENLVNNKAFKSKQEVYTYIAKNYVKPVMQQEFIDDCIVKNTFLSDERCNRIAFISSESRFYNKKEIVVIFNKTPFLWDEEQVQMIVFFNRKNRDYTKMQALNSTLKTFLHGHVSLAQKMSTNDAKEIIDFIVGELYS